MVLIHRYSGVLSAYGMALADVVHEEQETCSKVYSPGTGYKASRLFHSCVPYAHIKSLCSRQIILHI